MVVYADDRARPATVGEHVAEWSHLFADSPDELARWLVEHPIVLGGAHHAGKPWAYADITAQERLDAIWAGAKPIGWRDALAEMRRRSAAYSTPVPPAPDEVGGPPVPVLIRRAKPLGELFAEQAPDLPAGTFVCERGRGAAKWNAKVPRHAWEDPKQGWHRCSHCGVLYRSVPQPGGKARWAREWEWPDLLGASTADGAPFPACPGPGHAHAVTNTTGQV